MTWISSHQWFRWTPLFVLLGVLGFSAGSLAQSPKGETAHDLKVSQASPDSEGNKRAGTPRDSGPKEGPDGPWEPESAANHSSGDLRSQAAPGTSSMQSRTRSTLMTRILAGIALLLLAFVGWTSRHSWTLRKILPYLALFAGAFLLRWMWPEHTVFHENHHGYDYLRSIQQGLGQTYGFASSYIILMNILTSFSTPIDDSVFFWNTVFASLQVPLLAVLVERISRSKWAGWVAGLMWAITPHAIRLAPTESYFNMITCLLLASILAVVIAMEKVRGWKNPREAWAWTILALILVVLEAKTRVLTLGYPLVILLFALGLGAGKSSREKLTLVLGSIAIAFSLMGQILDVLERAKHSPQGRSLVDLSNVIEYGQDFVLLDPEVVSGFLLPLGILGVLSLLHQGITNRSPRVLFTLAGMALVTLIAGSVHGTFPSRVRFELPVNAVLTGLAAMGGLWVGQWAGNIQKIKDFGNLRPIPWLAGFALASTALMSHSWVHKPMHEQVSYTFLRQAVLPTIQSPEPIILLSPDAPAPTGTIPTQWWSQHRPGIQVTRNGEEGAPDYLYLGLECFWTAPGWSGGFPYGEPFPEAFQANGISFSIHPQCAEALGSWQWKPVHLQEVGRAIPNPCVDLKPTVKQVSFGLFERVQ